MFDLTAAFYLQGLEEEVAAQLAVSYAQQADGRSRGQRRTTIMARMPKRFVDETLWPHFERLSAELRTYLDEVTQRVVGAAIDGDTAEAEEEAAEPARRALETGGLIRFLGHKTKDG